MKKIFLTTAVLFFSSVAIKLCAQDEIEEVQKAFGKDKKELVRVGMDLLPADSIKFWPVYNKYEKERQKLGRERIIILQDYAEHFADISNTKADELVNRIFKNSDQSLRALIYL